MQRKYYTAVFEVHDQKKFGHLMTKLLETMADDEAVYRGARVTAFGQGDMATQAEAYESEIEANGVHPSSCVRDLLSDENPTMSHDDLNALVKAVMGE